MKKYLIIVLLLVFAFPSISNAQKAGLKTNALYWATSTPNLGLEVGMGDRFSFYLEGGYNPWTLDSNIEVNRKLKHFLVSPEVRYIILRGEWVLRVEEASITFVLYSFLFNKHIKITRLLKSHF